MQSNTSTEECRRLAETDTVTEYSNPVAELARDALRDSLESVRKSLKLAGLCWEQDTEHVHQLRVSGRRALAAVRLFSDVIPSSCAKWFTKKLKAILGAARQARDLDVLMRDQLPHCGRAAEKLEKVWRKQRKLCQKPIVRLHEQMQKNDCLQSRLCCLLSDLEKSFHAGNTTHQPSCETWAQSHVLDISRRFFAAIPGEPSAPSLHGLRILTKRFRYMCDFLEPVLEASTIQEVEAALAELQKRLGALQDHVVARDHFQRSLRHLRKPRHQKIVRQLIDREERKITQRVAEFRLRSESDACPPLQSCIEAVLSLVAVAQSPSEKSVLIKTQLR